MFSLYSTLIPSTFGNYTGQGHNWDLETGSPKLAIATFFGLFDFKRDNSIT